MNCVHAARRREEAFQRLEAMAAVAAAAAAAARISSCPAKKKSPVFAAAPSQSVPHTDAIVAMPVAITSMRELQQKQQCTHIHDETAFIVWDTETSGLKRSDCIVQLAIAFCAADGTCLGLYNQLWKLPAGLHIDRRAAEVHGITEQDLFTHGRDATVELGRVIEWFKQATAAGIPIVAFNSRFDERMLVQTARAHSCAALDPSAIKFSCLMVASRPHSNLRTANGRPKGFKNSELFVHFFKTEPAVRLHDAAGDIAVTAACYACAHEKGWI